MWDYVGIERSDERLAEAVSRLELIRDEVDRFYRRFDVDANLLELRNIVLVAGIVLQLASARRESRGLHQNRDHPAPDDVAASPPPN
jgi:L-aspartate oxidase